MFQKIRKLGNISHLQLFRFSDSSDRLMKGKFPTSLIFLLWMRSVFKAVAKQFRNPLGFLCQIFPWHKEELMAAITLPAAACVIKTQDPGFFKDQ